MSKVPPIFSNFIQSKGLTYLSSGIINKPGVVPSNNIAVPNPALEKKIISHALHELKQVVFDKNDINYLQSMGVNLKFNSGQEAVDFIRKNHVEIKFYEIKAEKVFAQFDSENNCILLSADYRNSTKKADILAISEAIFHEVGHAKDGDSDNSVQEEIDNLSLNVLAHKFYMKKYPQIFNTSDSLIVQDGVKAYERLFFDTDPTKRALINRLKVKYGDLPASDSKHPLTEISKQVKEGKI